MEAPPQSGLIANADSAFYKRAAASRCLRFSQGLAQEHDFSIPGMVAKPPQLPLSVRFVNNQPIAKPRTANPKTTNVSRNIFITPSTASHVNGEVRCCDAKIISPK